MSAEKVTLLTLVSTVGMFATIYNKNNFETLEPNHISNAGFGVEE